MLKKNVSLLLMLFILIPVFAYADSSPDQKSYTAYNIWRGPSSNMKCINYKMSNDFIPAGTEVINPRVKVEWDYGYDEIDSERIQFKIASSGETVTIGFVSKWHPRKTINDCKEKMFTNKNFDEMTKNKKDFEKKAIEEGVLVEGMSRKAVIMSYGYPPEHATSSLKEDTWTYLLTKHKRKKICFEDDKTIRCKDRGKALKNKELLSISHAESSFDFYFGQAKTGSGDVRVTYQPFLGAEQTATRNVSFDASSEFGVKWVRWNNLQPGHGFAVGGSFFQASGEDVDVDILTASFLYMARMRLHADERFKTGRLQPYIGLGLRWVYASAEVDFTPDVSEKVSVSGNAIGPDFRLGLKWLTTLNTAVFAELCYATSSLNMESSSEDIWDDSEEVDLDLKTVHTLIGLSVSF